MRGEEGGKEKDEEKKKLKGKRERGRKRYDKDDGIELHCRKGRR